MVHNRATGASTSGARWSVALFLDLYWGTCSATSCSSPGKLVVAKRDGVPGLLLHILIIAACTTRS